MQETVSQKELVAKFNKTWLKLLCLAVCGLCIYLYVRAEQTHQKLSESRDMLVRGVKVREAKATMAEHPRLAPVFMDFAIAHRILPSPDVFDRIFKFSPERIERKRVEAMFDSLFEKLGNEENMKKDVKRAMYTKNDSTLNAVWNKTIPLLLRKDRTGLIDSLYAAMMKIRADEIKARLRALDAYTDMVEEFSPEQMEDLRKGVKFFARSQGIFDVANHYHPEIRRKGKRLRELVGI